MRRFWLIAIAAVMSTSIFAQTAKPIEFEKYTLDNGLKVILHEDHSTPIVAISVMYHVGSKNEDPNRTGFAHFFEHLLFEGSENIDRGEYMKIVQNEGGVLNANTTHDRTYYYEILPSNKLELGLWMESERMLHAKIDQTGVETQCEVVKEEKRMRIDNQPYMSFSKHMFESAFTEHPYKWTVIGEMEHLNAAKLDEFMSFYQTFYVPNNAILSVAGDITMEETKSLVSKYFSTIPKGNHSIPRPDKNEPALKAEVRKTVYDNIQLPAIFTGYRMPGQGTPDAYALEMLVQYLSSGKSSALYKEIVDKKQLALQLGAFPYSLEDHGMFITYGIANSGVELEDLEAAVNEEINKVRNQKISDRDLQKIKNQIENDFVSSNGRVEGIAESLANYEMYFGDANLINTEIKRYMEVTTDDIQRVAQKYLIESNRVVLNYLPKEQEPVQ
ncbi:M16 family metallopeptidase [Aureibacter tunicatorum]|uniref:Zn-dependent peptidase n=1 Tax=Aureibacter tunicatorum TaxID=866807 RepID=A0AAE3XLJ3_9BACT|nr:pitrilysin family protein [Aureibacter tunicatorum]MDR6238818.1 putative Zn-dependent peptidase [Aureibacter tunicatorum]BDD05255.1 peptidase M16 [Aureibacter tunicatorum]